jgi:multidrug efflux pump subunit AcrA (membrane-fusion protein)
MSESSEASTDGPARSGPGGQTVPDPAAAPGAPAGSGTTPAGGPSGPGEMFRQEALQRLSARDTLENLLTITSARLWIALTACVVAIAAAVIWSIAGSAPTTVNGIGIILPASGVVQATALSSGTVTSLPIVTGIQVAEGQAMALLKTPAAGTSDVDAPIAGTIDEIYVTPGTSVGPGTPIAEMLPLGSPMSALMFVGAGEGKALQVGMHADISPSTAPSSQYGTITGVVTDISPLPITQQRLVALLGQRPGLINTVSALGAPLEVTVTLRRNPNTPSGYAWTSGTGPGFGVTPGTLLSGSVLVSEQSPASIAFSSQ